MGADFGNFIGGLNSTLDQQRSDARAAQERQDARENAIFTSLANSDDPDVRAAAVTGLLTGKHPGKFMDRFLGKMQTHPAFEQIRGLVENGHQAFPGASEGTRKSAEAQTSGQITGRVSGAVQGAKAAGAPLTPDQIQRVSMGAVGAAQSGRKAALQKVIITRADGSTVGGYFNPDPDNPGFYDDDGNPVTDVKSYQNTASAVGARTGAAGVGAKWQNMTMGQYRQMFGSEADLSQYAGMPDDAPIQARISSDGSEASAPVMVSPPPALGSYSFTATDQGLFAGNNRTGAATLAPGGAGLRAPTAPATAAGAVRELQNSILRLHPIPKGLLGTGPSPREREAWQRGVDNEAQRYGYPNFAALQAAVGQETANVQSAVVPAGPPPQAPGGPGGAAPARPARPARGAGGGNGMPPASGPADDPAGIRQFLPR